MTALSLPADGWYVLANASLHGSVTEGLASRPDRDGFVRADISIDAGRIKAIAPRGDKPLPPRAVDLAGRVVLPAFVDCHTHLDKGHIWPRMPNPDGSFMGALNAAGTADRLNLNVMGSGSAAMAGLKVDSASVNIAGSGDATFSSDGSVDANIVGSGDVTVRGSARCKVNSVGSGSLVCERETESAD